MLKQPQIYLDSNDFSLLSDPRRLDQTNIALRDELQGYADKSLVQFRFSMAHVCEAALTGPHAQEAAERRAELIYKVCGSNTLVTIEEIRKAEVTGSQDFSPYSVGRWYPQLEELLPKSPLADMKQMLTKELKAKGFTRQQRRAEAREVFGKNGLTTRARGLMDATSQSTLPELLAVLPFELNEMEALMSYVRGGPGWEIAVSACHRVLANPTWIMGRFAAAPDQMQGITVWLRQGASDFVQKMDASISVAHDFYRQMRANDAQREDEITKIKDPEMQAVRARAHLSGQQSRGNLMAGTRNKMEETILRRCVSGDNATPSISVLSLNQLRAKCPGIAASVAVGVHAARRASEEVTPRPLEASDFGDAMHAIYAPYVDIYRADGFMADAVTKALKGRGTSVARRLADVPALIREHLNNDTGL